MPAHVRDRGRYELFLTARDHRILVLNDERWYAWVEGDRGELLVRSDADHERRESIEGGRFFLVDFEDDPQFKDMPHLFLQKDDRYQEMMVPDGLPTEQDRQKKIVRTEHTIAKGDLEAYLEHSEDADAARKRP